MNPLLMVAVVAAVIVAPTILGAFLHWLGRQYGNTEIEL